MSKKQVIKHCEPKKLLGIHVIGAGKGESILLELPNGEWGVVDCFSPSLTKKHLNQTLRLLADFDVTRLCFICLTHPHEDHFRGITHLLEAYRENIKEFWVFPARYIRKVIVHLLTVAHGAEGRLVENTSVAELVEMFRVVEDEKRIRIRRTEDFKLLYDCLVEVGSKDIPLQIFSLAPSGNLANRYQREIDELNVTVADTDQVVKTYQRHNLISSVLLVKYGETKIILGGDAEKESWDYILKDEIRIKNESLKCELVKVSHHGSKSGMTENLWETLSPDGKCYAVLTPFKSQRLPSREAVEKIFHHTQALFSTALDATTVATRTMEDMLSEYRLQQVLKQSSAAARIRRLPFVTGVYRCSFYFGPNGDYVKHELDGSAGEILLVERENTY